MMLKNHVLKSTAFSTPVPLATHVVSNILQCKSGERLSLRDS